MTVYIFKHDGIYPVGACSVVCAETIEEAQHRLLALLYSTPGLARDAQAIAGKAVAVWTSGYEDKVILDGNY